MVDSETGEYTERKLTRGEAPQFYAELNGPVLVGMEACGNRLWFERLLWGLEIELRLGDAGKIRAMEMRKQKTDRRDAALLLKLPLENRFPQVWVPTLEQRDTRQLLLHRHKLVQMRRQVKNELQHLALNQGVQQKRKLWSAAGSQRWRGSRRRRKTRWLACWSATWG
jgi:transposase